MSITGTITGNLGADPETKTLPSGKTVTEARVASTSGWGDRKVTTWVSVSLWGAKGEAFAKHHRKGAQAIFTGCSVHNEDYNGKTYCKADAADFEFVNSRDSNQSRGPSSQQGNRAPPPRADPQYGMDDSVPF